MKNDLNRPPLAGLRVVEIGAYIAGPFCGQLLADFGADVIKVEPPGAGDPMRQWGNATVNGESLWWPVIARNKRCITIDLRKPEGQSLARNLIAEADVLVENFRPGTLKKWNLDPVDLQRINPALIVTQVSGFGQTGPYASRAGFASICEAMGGLRHLTGYPDRPPTRVGLSIGDTLAGLFAAFGVLAAVVRHHNDPALPGQTIDVSIVEAVLAMMESVVSEYSAAGVVRERYGPALPGIAPSNVYPSEDGELVLIAANADTLFNELAAEMGMPLLATDPKFSTHRARGDNQAELDRLIADWTSKIPRDEIIDRMVTRGIPVGPIYDAGQVCHDDHFRYRRSIVEAETSAAGTVLMQGILPKMSHHTDEIRWTGPGVGEHNQTVYRDLLGLSEAEIQDLEKANVI